MLSRGRDNNHRITIYTLTPLLYIDTIRFEECIFASTVIRCLVAQITQLLRGNKGVCVNEDHIDASVGLTLSLRLFERYRKNGILQASIRRIPGFRGPCKA